MKSIAALCVAFLFAGVAAGAQESASPRALYEQGREAQVRGQALQAIELYRASLRANSDYVQPMIGLAEAFFDLEQYREALDFVTAARKYDQRNLDLVILEGRVRLGLGQKVEARKLFESVLAAQPNNLEARFGLAELDISLGHRRDAATRYLETLRARPDSEKALLSLAVLEEEAGNRDTAMAYLEQALRYHTYDPRVHYIAGKLALQVGDARRAERYLRTAVALDETFVEARRLLAQALMAQGQPGAAVDMIKRVLEDERDNPLVWYTLGKAYEAAGSTGEAINALARVLQLRPDDEVARFALENLALEKLPINDPIRQKYAGYHLERGKLFEERNVLDRALLEYRRSLRLDPEAKEPRLQYGQVFLAMGYPGKYRQELEVLRKLGYTDSVIADDLEIIGSQSWDWVSSRWDVKQYEVDKNSVSVQVFHVGPDSRELHPGAGAVATEVFADLLRRYERIQVADRVATVGDFQEAFRNARGAGVDYFAVVSVEESERSFTARLGLYRTSTGRNLVTDHVYRTGNDRVLEALDILGGRFAARVPREATLLERRFDRGLVNLGRRDGLKEGDELVIVKKGAVRLEHDAVGFAYDDRDRIGTLTVTGLDENVAEGTVVRRDFFDLINPGDELLAAAAEKSVEPAAATPQEETGLLRRLFALVGR
jgi:tetratricopeptide (TPR) repeat protein